MGVPFLRYFVHELPKDKKPYSSESLLCLSMYINFLDLYIKLLEWKYFKTTDNNRKMEYCTTLAILDGEFGNYRDLFEHIENSKRSGEFPLKYEQEYSSEERLRLYVKFGMKCRQQNRLTDLKEFKNRAKGVEEAVKILLRVRRDVESSYDNTMRIKSSRSSLVKRIYNWIISK